MGLDTTHDCWHGAYSAFMRWRQEIARIAGLPPLDLMEGFYEEEYRDPIYFARKGLNDEKAFEDIRKSLPIKWGVHSFRPETPWAITSISCSFLTPNFS